VLPRLRDRGLLVNLDRILGGTVEFRLTREAQYRAALESGESGII
jgi:hypothetical protein